MTRIMGLALLILLVLSPLAQAQEYDIDISSFMEPTKEEKKEEVKEEVVVRKIFLGASYGLLPLPMMDTDKNPGRISYGDAAQRDPNATTGPVDDFKLSHGLTLSFDYKVWTYMTVGFDLDVYFLMHGTTDHWTVFNLDPAIRFLYPFLDDQLELYAKIAGGYSEMTPPRETTYGAIHGGNIKALPGLRYISKFGLAAFIEAGYFMGFYKTNDFNGFDTSFRWSSLVVNIGLGGQF